MELSEWLAPFMTHADDAPSDGSRLAKVTRFWTIIFRLFCVLFSTEGPIPYVRPATNAQRKAKDAGWAGVYDEHDATETENAVNRRRLVPSPGEMKCEGCTFPFRFRLQSTRTRK